MVVAAEEAKRAKDQAYVLNRVRELVEDRYFKDNGEGVDPRKAFHDGFRYGFNALYEVCADEGKELKP